MPTETPPLAAHDCEIPAFAGMVFGGTGELWANSANCGTRHCEIPAYAGMVFGRTPNYRRILTWATKIMPILPRHVIMPPMRNTFQLANCIRALSMDAVQNANCGHPGMPMGFADVATVLFADFLRISPKHPQWHNRDRFILSAGHGSMLLYSLLYLLGDANMTLAQIKNFRQLNSKTPGHPEFAHTVGVETTTGPLGQGFANAVGMALAERIQNAQFGDSLINHKTYVVVGDGCLSEGISHEAASFAGHLRLSNLIVLFDNNGITIDGDTALSVSDNHLQRFAACGWNTAAIDGHDATAIRMALQNAQDSDKPVFISCKTIIGFGAPNKQGTEKTHGSPLGEEEIAAARHKLRWQHPPFMIPPELLQEWRKIGRQHIAAAEEWQQHATQSAAFQEWMAKDMTAANEAFIAHKKELSATLPTVATRKASENTLRAIHGTIRGLVGGSADLSGSNNTKIHEQRTISAADFDGDYIHYGVREHAMAAAMNGMALHGITPFGGTFLVFSDYCRPAIRLSALMKQQVIYVMTHDSIGLGEDGPTHQPIEHLAALRAMPGIAVYRPADAIETAECWQAALNDKNRPSIIALSRQNTPPLRKKHTDRNLCAHGAYILSEAAPRDLTLLSSGTEVALAMQVAKELATTGLRAAVVSLPCWERFAELSVKARAKILGRVPRFAIEAAAEFGWQKYAPAGVFGINDFGASAPAEELYAHFGLVAAPIAEKIRKKLAGENS